MMDAKRKTEAEILVRQLAIWYVYRCELYDSMRSEPRDRLAMQRNGAENIAIVRNICRDFGMQFSDVHKEIKAINAGPRNLDWRELKPEYDAALPDVEKFVGYYEPIKSPPVSEDAGGFSREASSP
jgi:hypothetical protein